jgi:hypothetical protein
MTSSSRPDAPTAMATVLTCHYETRAGRAMAFGLPSSKNFHITFNYWVNDELHNGDFYSAKAVPQGTLFPITYDPAAPHLHNQARTSRSPILAIGIAGSIMLSAAWLLILRGCH